MSYFLNASITYNAEPSEGSELEKAAYALNTKQKIVKLVVQWVSLYGLSLKDNPSVVDFLEVISDMLIGYFDDGWDGKQVHDC